MLLDDKTPQTLLLNIRNLFRNHFEQIYLSHPYPLDYKSYGRLENVPKVTARPGEESVKATATEAATSRPTVFIQAGATYSLRLHLRHHQLKEGVEKSKTLL